MCGGSYAECEHRARLLVDGIARCCGENRGNLLYGQENPGHL